MIVVHRIPDVVEDTLVSASCRASAYHAVAQRNLPGTTDEPSKEHLAVAVLVLVSSDDH